MDELTDERLKRYQRLRTVQRSLNTVLSDRLSRAAEEDCAKALGIYKDGTLVFNSVDEAAVLIDYCIYDYRLDGQNAIQRYVAQTPVEPGSDEGVILDAMLAARYSVFAIDEMVKGEGVLTRDLLRGDGGFVADIGLSETGLKGLVLTGRILSPRDRPFSMFTGAALPVQRHALKRIGEEVPSRFGKTTGDIARMSPERAAQLSACVMRIVIEDNASSHVTYEDDFMPGIARLKPRVGRNDLCPCGSGKKYKRCCGKAAGPSLSS